MPENSKGTGQLGHMITSTYSIGEPWPREASPWLPPDYSNIGVPAGIHIEPTIGILQGRDGKTVEVRVKNRSKEDVHKNVNNYTVAPNGSLHLWRDLEEVAIYPAGEWLRIVWV